MELRISEEIREKVGRLRVAVVEAEAVNTEHDEGLWLLVRECEEEIRKRYTIDSLKEIAAIAATRRAYRALGKDPSRYRPSNEALARRVVQGKGLYAINTLVDIGNLASMSRHYSIGGFDRGKIVGNVVELGVGRRDEPYEGIGRGSLNIEGLPVYRDAEGGIGTPTSDHERTKMEPGTRSVLYIINAYDGDGDGAMECARYVQELLRRFAASDGGEARLIE